MSHKLIRAYILMSFNFFLSTEIKSWDTILLIQVCVALGLIMFWNSRLQMDILGCKEDRLIPPVPRAFFFFFFLLLADEFNV